MKRNSLLLFLSLLMCCGAMAQTIVSGKITDLTGKVLPGANIVCDELKSGTVSDANGNYRLEVVGQGVNSIRVTFIGYKPAMRQIQTRKNVVVDFHLEEEHLVTGEVIVSAIRASAKTPVAYTNITKADIQARQVGDDIPYLLSLSPSAVTTSEAGLGLGNTALRIRGTDPSRINITANGIPINDPESQSVFWVNMPDFSSSVEEIQIQRGVGTSTNGAAAFGATINMSTSNYKANPSATISSTAGSYGTFVNSAQVSSGLINNRFAFDARYSDLQSDGYVRRAFSDHHSLFLSGIMMGDHNLLKATIIHGKQQTGISWNGATREEMDADHRYNSAGRYTDENGTVRFYDNETDNYTQNHYQLAYSHILNNHFDISTTLHYTYGEGFYENYKEDRKFSKYGWDKVVVGNQTIDRTDAIQQKWMENHFYGITLAGNYHLHNLNLSVGGGWNHYDGDHFGEVIWMRHMGSHEKGDRWYFNNGDKKDFNIFAKSNWQPVEKLNVMVDLQYRTIDYGITGEDDDNIMMDIHHSYNFFNPKAGLYFDLNNKNQIYASFGISNREPTRTNFKDAKGDDNATPQAERLYDWEAGYRFQSNRFSANVNLFYMSYKDQLIPTGEKSDTGSDIMTNVEKSYRAGAELMAGVKITSRLAWDANLTLSANKIKNFIFQGALLDANWEETGRTVSYDLGTTDIAFSPNVVGSSIISFTPVPQFKIAFISKYVGEQYFDNTSSADRQLDAYFINNLQLDYHLFPQKMQRISFQLLINNLFDLKYENNAYGGASFFENGANKPIEETWAYYYPQAGTNVMGKITLSF